MKSDLCYFCKQNLDEHTRDELLEHAIKIVKGESET